MDIHFRLIRHIYEYFAQDMSPYKSCYKYKLLTVVVYMSLLIAGQFTFNRNEKPSNLIGYVK